MSSSNLSKSGEHTFVFILKDFFGCGFGKCSIRQVGRVTAEFERDFVGSYSRNFDGVCPISVGQGGSIPLGFVTILKPQSYFAIGKVVCQTSPVELYRSVRFVGGVNGVALAPLFAGNIIMNGVSAAPVNFHGGSFGGVFLGIVNCRGLWNDRGGIGGQKTLPKAVFHLGVVNLDFCFGQYCQIGLLNHSNGLPRFQLGMINTAEKTDADHFALQLGLLNNNGKYILPLINMTW